jgi:hypothetical protein
MRIQELKRVRDGGSSDLGDAMLTIAACLIALIIAWFALHVLTQIAVGLLVSPRVSGRAVLRQKLVEYGTDASRIPDAAYDELIERSLEAAKSFSALPNYRHENWRSLFVRLLQLEAQEIAELLRGGEGSVTSDMTRNTLARHGVL